MLLLPESANLYYATEVSTLRPRCKGLQILHNILQYFEYLEAYALTCIPRTVEANPRQLEQRGC